MTCTPVHFDLKSFLYLETEGGNDAAGEGFKEATVQDLSALVYAEPKAERPSDDLWRS